MKQREKQKQPSNRVKNEWKDVSEACSRMARKRKPTGRRMGNGSVKMWMLKVLDGAEWNEEKAFPLFLLLVSSSAVNWDSPAPGTTMPKKYCRTLFL